MISCSTCWGRPVSGPQWEKGTEQAATLPSCLILGLHHLEMGKRNVYVALHLFHIIHQCWRVVVVPRSCKQPRPGVQPLCQLVKGLWLCYVRCPSVPSLQ